MSSKDAGDETHTPIGQLTLSLALGDLSRRMAALETTVASSAQAKGPGRGMEFLKVVLGGWTALGFVFLVLFYAPLRDALNAVPDLVRSADEVGVMGISLKRTIRNEAARLGANALPDTIPKLSAAAIELLLRGTRMPDPLISYEPDDNNRVVAVSFPSELLLSNLAELETQKLIEVELHGQRGPLPTRVNQLAETFEKFRDEHPGKENGGSADRLRWVLNQPLPRGTAAPSGDWKLSGLGAQAVEVILKAVSQELSPGSETTRP